MGRRPQADALGQTPITLERAPSNSRQPSPHVRWSGKGGSRRQDAARSAMTGGIFPPLPPPLPKTAPLPLAARSDASPPLATTVGAARAPWDDAKKAVPVATAGGRKFGTVLTNSAAFNRAGCPVYEPKSPTDDRDAASRRYYHQYKYTPRHGIQKAYGASGSRASEPESEEQDKENANSSAGSADDEAADNRLTPSAWDSYVHRTDSNDTSELSIWSVTPTALAEIADSMRASLKYPRGGRDLTFQKFYALPVFDTSRFVWSSAFAFCSSSL
jgi:hypothetical protein